jgi:hypothetical protein
MGSPVGPPPYFAQWESPTLVAAILAGNLRARDDPGWARSGAVSPEDYEYWSWRTCGVACLRMILAWWGVEPPGAVALAKDLLRVGGYVYRPDGGVDGLIYRPVVDYLGARWSIPARVAAPLGLDALHRSVDAGDVVIASVSPAIRRPGSPPPARGGHLVLVVARTEAALVIHNPSGDTTSTQSAAEVPVEHFEACFAGRGMVVAAPPDRMPAPQSGDL